MSAPVAAVPPQPPCLPAALAHVEPAALAHDASYAEAELRALALPEQHAGGVAFEACRLAGVDLSGSRLEELKLVDCAVEGSDMANLTAHRTSIARVLFAGGRMTGAHLIDGSLRDVTFRECRADLASFGRSQLTRVRFEDCILVHCDFLDSALESVCFVRCDLSGADFRGARMRCCELRGNDLSGLHGISNLKGAALEWPDVLANARAWASALGIGVLDE